MDFLQPVNGAHPRVFHTRLRDFELSAERLVDPALDAKPIAVVSSPRQNGTILSLSGEAVEEGLTYGMRVSLARKVSRRTLLLPYNPSLYQKMQGILYNLLSRYSPVVEPSGYGRFFLDMTGMEGVYKSTGRVGHLLVKDVARQINLSPWVGISKNKLVSSIATKVAPTEPVLEVPQGEEPQFLAPLYSTTLPVAKAPVVSQSLHDLNLMIVQDVQTLVRHGPMVRVAFGSFSRQVSAQAQGIDTSVVQPPRWQRKGGRQIIERYTLPEDTNDEGLLHSAIQHLVDVVGYKLRRSMSIAEQVKMIVHYTDGYMHEVIGKMLSNDAVAVTQVLTDLYHRANKRRNRIRALTADIRKLKPKANQLSLFDSTSTRDQRISRQLDLIRAKYGVASILTANQLCLEE